MEFFARFASCLELTDSNAPEILFDMTLTVEDRLSTTQVKASGLTKTCRTLHEHDEWPVFLGNPLFGVLIKEIAWWPKTIHSGFIMCGYLCSHPSGCPSIPQYTQYQLQQDWFQGFGWSCRPTRPTAWWRFIWYILTSKPSIPLTVLTWWSVVGMLWLEQVIWHELPSPKNMQSNAPYTTLHHQQILSLQSQKMSTSHLCRYCRNDIGYECPGVEAITD